ncbi:MAG: ABC transporter ATP-binding protein [Hyphomicrobiaceae bacterium]|nr:ABC transporter ATP-binding protein [Hyphomicrobiaceae bacterium]
MTRAAAPVVSLAGVGKTWPSGVQALRDVDLEARPGELVGLLGPSGCGKSTLLRIVAGLETPTTGQVRAPHAEPGRQPVGFVFQEATLMPWARALDNVALPLRLAGMGTRERRERAGEALAAVGLSHAAENFPHELSGGMKMRVSIARALVGSPELLLLDEPFAALDEMARFQLNDLLLSLREEKGFTTLFVTHSVFEAAYLCDRALVMTAMPGTIAAEHDFGRARPDPALRETSAYLDRTSMLSASLRHAATLSGEPAAP